MSTEPTPEIPALHEAFPTRVGDVMTRAVVTLFPHQSFTEAIALLARHRFRHLLIVGMDRRLVGVLSDRDLLRFLTRNPHVDQTAVDEVMRTHPLTARPDTPLSVAVAIMLQHRINCLPVLDEAEHVCGIVTSTDLLRVLEQIQHAIGQGGSTR